MFQVPTSLIQTTRAKIYSIVIVIFRTVLRLSNSVQAQTKGLPSEVKILVLNDYLVACFKLVTTCRNNITSLKNSEFSNNQKKQAHHCL